MFRNRLIKVNKHLSRQAAKMKLSCFRVYDHDLPEFPFCIERFYHLAHVHEYRRRHELDEVEYAEWKELSESIICEVLQIKPEDLYFKERKRKADRHDQYEKTGTEGQFYEVEEQGLKFFINLTDYLDTGLFLDHRITRQMVKEQAEGKRVLNLFCYTGSFSVYAMAGGAISVDSIDLSKTYLAWAERNMKLNFPVSKNVRFHHADVIQMLPEIPAGSADIIILDPPTFSNSKRMNDMFDVQRDHVLLIRQCLRILAPGGKLFFSTNFTRFQLDSSLQQEARFRDITRATTPFDFAGKLKRACFLFEK